MAFQYVYIECGICCDKHGIQRQKVQGKIYGKANFTGGKREEKRGNSYGRRGEKAKRKHIEYVADYAS